MQHREGFFMLEALVVVVLALFVVSGALSCLLSYRQVMLRMSHECLSVSTLIRLADRIAEDVRHAGIDATITSPHGDQLVISGTRHITWGITAGRVWRREAGITATVALAIDELSWDCCRELGGVSGVWLTILQQDARVQQYVPVYARLPRPVQGAG